MLEFDPEGMEVVIEKFENTNLPYEDINVKSMWHRDNLWHLMIKTNAKEKRFAVTVK